MSQKLHFSRRRFFKNTFLGSSSIFLFPRVFETVGINSHKEFFAESSVEPLPVIPLDLAPARWIWYNSQRTLPNTIILFRRDIEIGTGLAGASGWIFADSRYRLYLNGRRLHFGPAPCDPRNQEADPLELKDLLVTGTNVIGIEVLYYGHGDGTWPFGKPGLIMKLDISYTDGRKEMVVSDNQWKAMIARAWKPGQYKRWYLRSLQEEFDAREYPYGWNEQGYDCHEMWNSTMIIEGAPDRPTISNLYPDYLYEAGSQSLATALLPRSIPFMNETMVSVKRLAESHGVRWKGSPDDYFDFLAPGRYEIIINRSAIETEPGVWKTYIPDKEAVILTFEFAEQIVGWPYFTIEGHEGTIIELMVQEGHDPSDLSLMNNHFHSWSRFICREGTNHFETFDFESVRWLQLHIRNASGAIIIRDLGIRRRIFPWKNDPVFHCSDGEVLHVFRASINTLYNSAQETIVDGMGRERQQYANDGGIQLMSIIYTFGDKRLPARYIRTFSKGLTKDGYFLDCWPAYDRLARIMERQLDLTPWGPLLDHGVAFVFENYLYYLMTGDLDPGRDAFPNLVRFVRYLYSIKGKADLLPVEEIGVPAVWLDHHAFLKPRHKQCAFNIYVAGMLEYAFTPMCRLFGEDKIAEEALDFSGRLLDALKLSFWSTSEQVYISNLPWLEEEKGIRMDDRTLAMSVIFGYCPDNRISESLDILAGCPPEMGFSYPGNAHWRFWALGMGGKEQVIIDEIRNRWAKLDSVRMNNTLQEDWDVQPDSNSQWSHNPVAPLLALYMIIAGIVPLEPGFKKVRIFPRLGDLEELYLEIPVLQGKITFGVFGKKDGQEMVISLPGDTTGELYLPKDKKVNLPEITGKNIPGYRAYLLEGGKEHRLPGSATTASVINK